MVDLIWSPRAISDLEEILEFISQDSEFYARQLAMNLISSVEILKEFPKAGRIVPEFQRADLREKIYKNFRIVYRLMPNQVEIAAIIHTTRLLPSL